MAHNILQFAAIKTAWHRLGTIDGTFTRATDAMIAADMDWDIYKQPLVAQTTGGELIPTGTFGLMREPISADREWRYLGSCGAGYDFWQNRDAADRVDLLAEQTGWKFETMGVLGNGATLFTCHAMGESVINGNTVKNFFTLQESRDGKQAARIIVSPIAVVCQNTLNLAIKSATGSANIRHDSEFKNTADWVMNVVAEAHKAGQSVNDALNILGEITMDSEMFITMLDAVFPTPTMPRIMTMPNLTGAMAEKRDRAEYVYQNKIAHVNRAREYVTANFESNADVEDRAYDNTAWRGYQAVTRYTTHQLGMRDGGRGRTMSDKSRAESDLFGDGAVIRNRAYEFLTTGF